MYERINSVLFPHLNCLSYAHRHTKATQKLSQVLLLKIVTQLPGADASQALEC